MNCISLPGAYHFSEVGRNGAEILMSKPFVKKIMQETLAATQRGKQ